MSEQKVQEVGQLKLGETTTVKFQRGITKKYKRDVISMRAWVAGKRYSGPTKQGFNLIVQTAEEFYRLGEGAWKGAIMGALAELGGQNGNN